MIADQINTRDPRDAIKPSRVPPAGSADQDLSCWGRAQDRPEGCRFSQVATRRAVYDLGVSAITDPEGGS